MDRPLAFQGRSLPSARAWPASTMPQRSSALGNGMLNVCVATLVTTRTGEGMRGRVAAALGAVLNAASVGSLAAGGALAAVLSPRQVYLLAGALGCAVTAVLAARLRNGWAHRANISFAAERSRA